MSEHTAEAVALVNQIKTEMAELARVIVQALGDNRIQFWEIWRIGREGSDVGTAFMHLFEGASDEVRMEVLRVLEHGMFVGPDA